MFFQEGETDLRRHREMKKIIGLFIVTLMIISTTSTASLIIKPNEIEQLCFNASINQDIIEMIEQIDENTYYSFLEDIVGFGPRFTGTPVCEEAGTYIYNELESMGLEVRFHEWDYKGFSDKNIEAILHGTDGAKSEVYIISCHYDTQPSSPGADDAGSGVAAMLSIANILSAYSFEHTVRFVAFSGECNGALGSHEYVQELIGNNDNIIGVLHADGMGQAENEEELDNIWISETPTSQWITNFMKDVNQQYDSYINLKVTRSGAYYFSDHMSFWEFGYSAIWFAEVKTDGYDGVQDTLEHINVEYCLRGTKLLLATLATLADSNTGSFPNKPIIAGPEEGKVGEELTFSTNSIDPYNKALRYLWDWGDGIQSEWSEPIDSGETVTTSYSWDEEGIYQVKVKVKNEDELESDWSNPFLIGIPKKNDGTDQQQTEHGNLGYGCYYGAQWAQSFIPSQNTISMVSLYLFKDGGPPGLTVSIRDDLNNADLTSAYITGDDIGEELKGVWYEFNIPEIEVTPGQTYYIIWTPDNNEPGNIFYWSYGNDDPYPNGITWFQAGYLWEENEIPDSNNGDFCFKTYHAKSKSKSINMNLMIERILDWIFEGHPLLELLQPINSPQPKGFSLNQSPSFVKNPGKLINHCDYLIQ